MFLHGMERIREEISPSSLARSSLFCWIVFLEDQAC